MSLISNPDVHTHVKSKRIAAKLIRCIETNKLPLDEGLRFYESLVRLSQNDVYSAKVESIIAVRKQKGVKQNYYNPHKKFSG